MEQRITIQQIAEAAGVSGATVHRALYGKAGVSPAVAAEIRRLAEERGYPAGGAHPSLKRKPLRIAVAFPTLEGENRYFYSELRNGYHDCLDELGVYRLEVTEISYHGTAEHRFAAQVRELVRRCGHIDGLLTGGRIFREGYDLLTELSGRGMPVVLVGEAEPGARCLCSVRTDFHTEGMLAAELLTGRLAPDGKILMCAGDKLLFSNRESAAGFEAYLHENGCPHPLVCLHGYEEADGLREKVARILAEDSSIRGLYSVNLRNSLMLARVVEEMGLAGKVQLVGSDLCPESAAYMRRGIITNIISKRPRLQARVGAKILTDHLLHARAVPHEEQILHSAVIFKSNLAQYAGD